MTYHDSSHKTTHPVRRILCLVLVLGLVVAGLLSGIHHYVVSSAKGRILTPDAATALDDIDCILVLGAGLRPDGSPSDMLRDRILTGCDLWQAGAAPVLFMSGDGQSADYDEVGAMLSLAEAEGVPQEALAGDRLGLCTYDSVMRACRNYGYRRILIVTQKYHLYRALYIAGELGIEAYGVSADRNTYRGQAWREGREIAASIKDFFKLAWSN